MAWPWLPRNVEVHAGHILAGLLIEIVCHVGIADGTAGVHAETRPVLPLTASTRAFLLVVRGKHARTDASSARAHARIDMC